MRYVDRSPVRDTPGSTDIGPRTGVTMPGCQDAGTVRLMKGRIGTILTTITSGKAGNCMKAIGIMRTTTGTTETMAKSMETNAITNGAVLYATWV
jgi:hypothetical protein